ncbi:MAG: nucleotidyltransferase domain-containing protein [bacterium]
MDKVNAQILEKIKKFIDKVNESKIFINDMYLFGSSAKGTNDKYSDIDIAIISQDFEGIRFYDKQKLFDAVISTDVTIEPLTFKPEDFNDDNPIAYEIRKYGINLKYLYQ